MNETASAYYRTRTPFSTSSLVACAAPSDVTPIACISDRRITTPTSSLSADRWLTSWIFNNHCLAPHCTMLHG